MLDEAAESETPLFPLAQSLCGTGSTPGGATPFSVREQALTPRPLVPVRESTDFRKFDYGTKLRRLNRARYRRVFAERQVSARAQVICKIEIQKATQRRLVEHDHVVQALASN